MQNFEVEVKSLLGSEERAEIVRARMRQIDPNSKLVSKNIQRNHYFLGGDLEKLAKRLSHRLSASVLLKLKDIATRGTNLSVRTRDKDGAVFLVLKASVGDDTSANGVARMEFEEKVGLTLDELDQLLLEEGFSYQAKWSREREEYICKDTNVCLDRNAGYGWLAEFEKVVQHETELSAAQDSVRSLMRECGAEELPQERLERMFAFYNEHWPEYYGTQKIFTVV